MAGAQFAFQDVRAGDGDTAQALKQALAVQPVFLAQLCGLQARIRRAAQGLRLAVTLGGLFCLRAGVAAQAVRAMLQQRGQPRRVSGRAHQVPPPQRRT